MGEKLPTPPTRAKVFLVKVICSLAPVILLFIAWDSLGTLLNDTLPVDQVDAVIRLFGSCIFFGLCLGSILDRFGIWRELKKHHGLRVGFAAFLVSSWTAILHGLKKQQEEQSKTED